MTNAFNYTNADILTGRHPSHFDLWETAGAIYYLGQLFHPHVGLTHNSPYEIYDTTGNAHIGECVFNVVSTSGATVTVNNGHGYDLKNCAFTRYHYNNPAKDIDFVSRVQVGDVVWFSGTTDWWTDCYYASNDYCYLGLFWFVILDIDYSTNTVTLSHDIPTFVDAGKTMFVQRMPGEKEYYPHCVVPIWLTDAGGTEDADLAAICRKDHYTQYDVYGDEAYHPQDDYTNCRECTAIDPTTGEVYAAAQTVYAVARNLGSGWRGLGDRAYEVTGCNGQGLGGPCPHYEKQSVETPYTDWNHAVYPKTGPWRGVIEGRGVVLVQYPQSWKRPLLWHSGQSLAGLAGHHSMYSVGATYRPGAAIFGAQFTHPDGYADLTPHMYLDERDPAARRDGLAYKALDNSGVRPDPRSLLMVSDDHQTSENDLMDPGIYYTNTNVSNMLRADTLLRKVRPTANSVQEFEDVGDPTLTIAREPFSVPQISPIATHAVQATADYILTFTKTPGSPVVGGYLSQSAYHTEYPGRKWYVQRWDDITFPAGCGIHSNKTYYVLVVASAAIAAVQPVDVDGNALALDGQGIAGKTVSFKSDGYFLPFPDYIKIELKDAEGGTYVEVPRAEYTLDPFHATDHITFTGGHIAARPAEPWYKVTFYQLRHYNPVETIDVKEPRQILDQCIKIKIPILTPGYADMWCHKIPYDEGHGAPSWHHVDCATFSHDIMPVGSPGYGGDWWGPVGFYMGAGAEPPPDRAVMGAWFPVVEEGSLIVSPNATYDKGPCFFHFSHDFDICGGTHLYEIPYTFGVDDWWHTAPGRITSGAFSWTSSPVTNIVANEPVFIYVGMGGLCPKFMLLHPLESPGTPWVEMPGFLQMWPLLANDIEVVSATAYVKIDTDGAEFQPDAVWEPPSGFKGGIWSGTSIPITEPIFDDAMFEARKKMYSLTLGASQGTIPLDTWTGVDVKDALDDALALLQTYVDTGDVGDIWTQQENLTWISSNQADRDPSATGSEVIFITDEDEGLHSGYFFKQSKADQAHNYGWNISAQSYAIVEIKVTADPLLPPYANLPAY